MAPVLFSVLGLIFMSVGIGALPFTKPALDTRMLGGNNAEANEFPYQASVQHFGRHICGGVILNKYFILTAARCFQNVYDVDEVQVRVGGSQAFYGGIVVDIKFYALHPDFDQSFASIENDVAVIKLAYPLYFDKNIQPASLNKDKDELEAGTNATAIGWQRIKVSGELAGHLNKLDVTVTDFMDCFLTYMNTQEITEKQLCTSPGVCQGDAGSPLLVDGLVVGLSSWFGNCGDEKYPAVYSNVAEYAEWVNELIKSEM